MKKIKLLVALCFAAILYLNSASAGFPKIPLMERFTQASCGPCLTYNNNGYSNWINANKDNLAIIHYHTSWPGTDPMYSFNQALPNTRVNQYNSLGAAMEISGVPDVKFNGQTAGNGMPNNALLDQLLATESAKTVPVQITPTISVKEGDVNVHVEVFSEEEISDVRLQVLILQKEVNYDNPPGSNGEKSFPFVARYALPTMNGENLTLEANKTITREFTQSISISEMGELYVVAFIEEVALPHNIIQAGISNTTISILPMSMKVEQTPIYSKVPAETDNTHSVIIENPNNFDIRVTTEKTQEGNWLISEIPSHIDIAAKSFDTITVITKSGEKPSGNLLAISFVGKYNGTETNDTAVYAGASDITIFYTMTDNTKYAYLTGLGSDPATVNALNNTTYFNGELVAIPTLGSYSLVSPIISVGLLDNLEFLGLSFSGVQLMNIILNNISLIPSVTAIHNNGGKLYMENEDNYYCVNLYKASYPTIYNTMEPFFKQCFGTWNSTPDDVPMLNSSGTAYISINIDGKDKEISEEKTYTINGQAPRYAYAEAMNFLAPEASRVFAHSSMTCMVRYAKDSARSVQAGARIASFAPADRIVIANNIVDWLFGTTSIEDGETNLTTKNGINLSTYPNPVTNTSNVVIKNTNEVETYTELYLIDLSGEKVYTVFSGALSAGENNFNLSASNLNSGKYFLVAETKLGKTYMSVTVIK